MMRKNRSACFIDCGGHVGESVHFFKETAIYGRYDWEIHTFEPHPELVNRMLCRDDADVCVHKAAVWSANGALQLFPTTGLSSYCGLDDVPWGSSTVMASKTSGNVSIADAFSVPCVDLSEFILDRAVGKELVVLKLDVEGAEYEVLPHLLRTGAIDLVDHLFVEFHVGKMKYPRWKHWLLKMRLHFRRVNFIEERSGHTSGNWFEILDEGLGVSQ